jgi:hypothetical protein
VESYRSARRSLSVDSSRAPSFLGIFVAWQVFAYFVDPFFGALLKVVHPADVYE